MLYQYQMLTEVHFQFNTLCYELVPYYKGANTVFDVSPSSVSVNVKHQHVTVPQKFQVTGFSVGDRVVDGNEMGVEGVKIIVDGRERFITDEHGYYKLDQVLPNMASIEEINAISYYLCGVVRMVSGGLKAKVALTHGPENVKPQKKQIDASGKFCFEVLPGEYRLSAIAATPEGVPGLMNLPSYLDVVVKSPLLDIEFSEALINIHGAVVCREKCGLSVSVSLVRHFNKHNEERKTIGLTDESSEFRFS